MHMLKKPLYDHGRFVRVEIVAKIEKVQQMGLKGLTMLCGHIKEAALNCPASDANMELLT